MSKEKIIVQDFNLFADVVKSISRLAESAKFIVTTDGLSIYGKNDYARCEISTNSIYAEKNLEFSVQDVKMLLKIISTIKDIHNNDYSDFKFIVDLPALRFESKKFKTKLMTCKEELIEKWISKQVTTPLKSVLDFKTTSDMIKRVLSHSFIFSDAAALRIYLKTEEGMENNTIYSTLGNDANNLTNEITLKFGLITSGALDDRKLVLDCDRLQIFQMLDTDEINISLMDKNVLVAKANKKGKNDTFFNLTIYNSIRKN